MILRVCVVIPSFDNARTISEVVKDVITNCSLSVLVVDDGSETPVSNVLYSWEVRQALEEGRVRVERFEKSRGKGAALQFAVDLLVREGFTHMLTMDGDGRHFGSEIGKLLELCRQAPDELILGDRQSHTEAPQLPQKAWRTRIASFWIGYQTGSYIQDAQSGFRLYPLFHLQTMKCWAQRFDFDLEVLIRLLWKGVRVRETVIDSQPLAPAAPLPLWMRLWQGLRSSTLNMTLLVVSLLKTHRSPLELATALGLGVFVGCTPFFGFHTLIIAALALMFRLNVVVMWLGTHVSTPLIAPLVVVGEIWIGRHWLHIGEAATGRKAEFYQWLAGSVVLGLGLGLASAIVAFSVSWYFQRRKQRDPRHDRREHSRFSRAVLRLLLKHFGLSASSLWQVPWVNFHYLCGLQLRRALNEYWTILRPGLNWRTRQKLIFKHLRMLAQIQTDREYAVQKPDGLTVNLHVGENFVSQAGQSPLILSAHLGDWNFTRSLLKLPKPLSTRTVHAQMVDRSGPRGFELLPFLGKLAPFDIAPFQRALEESLPLFVTFGFKDGPLNYEFYAKASRVPAMTQDHTPGVMQALEGAKIFVAELEKYVRQYPEQWHNLYPYWSELPPIEDRHEFFEDLLPPVLLKPEGENPSPL